MLFGNFIFDFSKMKTFDYPVIISEKDIDQLGHVNNVAYLKWVQEAAIAHWNSLATAEMKNNYLWVVIRHEIDYLSASFLNSRLIAKTWVGVSEGARSERFVDIIEAGTNKPIARVKTVWSMIDIHSKRPKRVSEEIIRLFS
jgi:acyl-CoA thioester hydrolase